MSDALPTPPATGGGAAVRRRPVSTFRAPLVFAALSGAAGFVVALVATSAGLEGPWTVTRGFPAVAFLSGAGTWWALVSRRGTLTPTRGAVAGALGSLLAHPLTWGALYFPPLLLARGDLKGVGFLLALWAAMSVVTLVKTGWAVVPLGAFLGWDFTRFLRGTAAGR